MVEITSLLRQDWRALDLDDVATRCARTPFVLIGEASHGTHEFYALRAELTRRLIEDHGFDAVAIEGDWPDTTVINDWLRDPTDDAMDALAGFERFPRWMWRNTVMRDFVAWLGDHRRRTPREVDIHGLDLYSLHRSAAAVIELLGELDPAEAERARARYACFDHTGVDGQRYGAAVVTGRSMPCEPEVIDQLRAIQAHRLDDGLPFGVEQHARVVRNAEAYYRAMYRGGPEAWNLRDEHMADTLAALVEQVERGGVEIPKVVVWAHNSHLGDARATEFSRRGEHNLGQLVRERWPGRSTLVGLTTYRGAVTCASDWEGEIEQRTVRPALAGSVETLLHEVSSVEPFWFDTADPAVNAALDRPRLQRMIGVIYRPQTERISHYVDARPARQFDVLVHVDETTALEPLDERSGWAELDPPQTYPWAV